VPFSWYVCWSRQFSLRSFTSPYLNQVFYAWLALLASSSFLVFCLVYFSTMKMEAVRSSRRRWTLTTRRHIQHVITGILMLLFVMTIHYELKTGSTLFRFHWRVTGNFDRVGKSFPDREIRSSHAGPSTELRKAGPHNEWWVKSICEICGFHGSDYEDSCPPDCNAL
jgi:hypothetical protein